MIARASLYAERWGDAVTACDEVLKLGYDLLPGKTAADYYKIFSTPNNQELIIPVYFQSGISMKQHNFNTYFCPPYDGQPHGAADKVGASATPTDEYASSFDIRVGGSYEAFDWDNLSKYGNKPFDNREPRFYASILYNDATWIGRKLELYAGGKDNYMDFSITGQDNVHKSTTGYIFRKFMDDSGKVNFTNILSGTYWTEMRLAEIYLIRSEAYARQNQFGPAYEDLRTIRDRVGLPVLAQKGNWQDYLHDLAKERICELGLEGHRFFDLVRWGHCRRDAQQQASAWCEDYQDGRRLPATSAWSATRRIVSSPRNIRSSRFPTPSCRTIRCASRTRSGNNLTNHSIRDNYENATFDYRTVRIGAGPRGLRGSG